MRILTAPLLAAVALCFLVVAGLARTSQGRMVRSAGPTQSTAPVAQVGGAMNAAVEHQGTLWLGVGPRLVALDVDDPFAPIALGRTAVLPDVVLDLAVESARPMAWVAAGAWLVGIDLDRPTAPDETGRLELPGRARRVALASGHAWVLLDDGRIVGIDVADARRPRPVAEVAADARASCTVDLAGRSDQLVRLAIDDADAPQALVQVLDVAVPSSPVALPGTALGKPVDASACWYGTQLAWAGDTLWARAGDVLAAYRANGGVLEERGHDADHRFELIQAMAIAGTRAYASLTSGWGDNWGVAVLDLSDPNEIGVLVEPDWIIGGYPGGFSRAIVVSGDHVWVSSSGGFLTALDRRDGRELRAAGAYATIGEVHALALDAGRLYAQGYQSVQVVDVHDPAAPAHLGLVAAGYHFSGVSAFDDLVGLAVFGQGDALFSRLQLVDAGDPRRPVPLVAVDPPGSPAGPRGIDMTDDLLAFAAEALSPRVALYDLARPASPVVTATVALDRRPKAVVLAEDRLFTLTAGDGVVRLLRNDVARGAPASGAITLATDATEYPDAFLAVGEHHAFVLVGDGALGPTPARGALQLYAVDIAQPDRLELAAASSVPCEPGCRPGDLATADGHVFVAGGEGIHGVMVIDVTEVASPRLARRLVTGTPATSLQIAGGEWLYVATGAGGLEVHLRPDGGWNAPTGDPAPILPSLTPAAGTPTRTPPLPSPTATRPPEEIFVPRALDRSS